MTHLLNTPDSAVQDLITGLVGRCDRLSGVEDWPVVVRAERGTSGVAVISGGGSGHEPAHAGYVGAGMLDAAVCGPVFTSPSVDAILAAVRAVATEPARDVLMVVKNYTGDRLNFGIAARQARADGLRVRTVVVADDVALGAEVGAGRRGLAGTVLVHKVIGASLADGADVEEAARTAEKFLEGLGTMGISLGPCHVPGATDSSFDLDDEHVEWGLGIHGEPGVEQGPAPTARQVAQRLVRTIVEDRELGADDDVLVLVNGLGGLSALELEVMGGEVLSAAREHGLRPRLAWSGNLLTSLDMPGVSVTLARLNSRVRHLLEAPTDAPAWLAPTVVPEQIATVRVTTPDPFAAAAAAVESTVPVALHESVLRAARALIDAEDQLTRADRAVGDGDLGTNLARGARAVIETADRLATLPDPQAYFTALSAVLRHHVGGTSGPLYAVLTMGLARGAAALDGADTNGSDRDASSPGGSGEQGQTVTGNDSRPSDSSGIQRTDAAASLAFALCRGLAIGVEDMGHLGGAEEGDCTMLDALIPAARAAQRTVEEGCESGTGIDPEKLASAVVEAAQRGARATAELIASKGRASYMGERSRDVQDPGATAVTVWLAAALSPWL